MSTQILEALEARIAPATLYAVDNANNLLKFDSATPGTIDSTTPITGMVSGDDVVAIDFRPATGELYALADGSRLYKVDLETGATTQIATQMPTLLDGASFGFDFNPVADRARIVSDMGQNIRLHPDLLTVSVDTDLNGDVTALTASAYSNNYANAQSTILYGLDAVTDTLYVQNPNAGTTSAVGPLGIDFSSITGFDIANASGTAFAALTVGGATSLYTIDLATGAATSAGTIGNGAIGLVGLSAAMPVVAVNGKTATYVDSDGDLVTIKTTKGEFGTSDFHLAVAANGGGVLTQINLADDGGEFAGAGITISAKKSPTGDGLAAVGFLNATGIDLGKVVVKGDLGRLSAGDADNDTFGVASLQVDTMGRHGTATQPPFPIMQTTIMGATASFSVKHDLTNTQVFLLNAETGSIKIGGSLLGGSAPGSASFFVTGVKSVSVGGDIAGGIGPGSGRITSAGADIGSVVVKGDIIGGGGDESGSVFAEDNLGSVKVGGDLVGGSGLRSGSVIAQGDVSAATVGGGILGGDGVNSGYLKIFGSIGKIQVGDDVEGGLGAGSGGIYVGGNVTSLGIKGSLLGGDGNESGEVFIVNKTGKASIGGDIGGGDGAVSGNLQVRGGATSVVIGGSLIGGAGNDTGTIYFPFGAVTTLTLKGDLVGGSISGAASLTSSGKIEGYSLGKLAIGGSVVAGVDNSTGALLKAGGIYIANDAQSIAIKGNVIGNDTHAVDIVTRGQVTPAADTDLALGSLAVSGYVKNTQVLAGFDGTLAPVNGNAQIGKIVVGKDWTASSVSAGVMDVDADGFGDGDDSVINNLFDSTISRIASIVIKGSVQGTPAAGDKFGFVAQEIGSFQIGSRKLALDGGIEGEIFPLASVTNDVTAREVIII